MNSPGMCHFYTRGDKAFIPTVARTEAGFYIDVEPVAVVDARDSDSVAAELRIRLEAGNSLVATPSRAGYAPSPVLGAARLRSWKTFEVGAKCFAVYLRKSGYEIPAIERARDGGWVEVPGKTLTLPVSTPVGEVAALLASRANTGSF